MNNKIPPNIGILYKFINKLSVKGKLMIYNDLIHPHLNYLSCASAYNRNNILQKSLQTYQNKALKIVYNLPRTHPTISLYRNRTILPSYGLHNYQGLLFVFKSVHGKGQRTIIFLDNQSHFNPPNILKCF